MYALAQNQLSQLPKTVSCFTFSGVVLLPRGKLPLAVVEPAHLQMVDEALKTHRLLGVVQLMDFKGTDRHYYTSGCLGKITTLHESEENGYFVILSGLTRFSIVKQLELGKNKGTFEVNYDNYSFDLLEEGSVPEDRQKLLELLKEYFWAHNLLPNWEEIENAPDEKLITSLAMLCPFHPQEKQALLETPTLRDRYKMLTAILEMSFNERMGKNVKH